MPASVPRHCCGLVSRLLLLKTPAEVQQLVQHLQSIMTILLQLCKGAVRSVAQAF
jgi:hypothetical protein